MINPIKVQNFLSFNFCCLWYIHICCKVVSIHWTGLLDWNTGLEYWTGLLDWSTAPNFYHTDKDFTVLHTGLMHYTLRGIIPIFTVSQSAAIVKV